MGDVFVQRPQAIYSCHVSTLSTVFKFLGHRLDDLVDWNSGVSVRPYVRLYVHKVSPISI